MTWFKPLKKSKRLDKIQERFEIRKDFAFATPCGNTEEQEWLIDPYTLMRFVDGYKDYFRRFEENNPVITTEAYGWNEDEKATQELRDLLKRIRKDLDEFEDALTGKSDKQNTDNPDPSPTYG